MLNSFISALQGPAEEAVDDSATTTVPVQPAPDAPKATHASEPSAQDSAQAQAEAPSDLADSSPTPAQDTSSPDDAEDPRGSRASSASEAAAEPASEPAAAPGLVEAGQGGTGNAFSFWGMATGLVDTVRKGTNELASR